MSTEFVCVSLKNRPPRWVQPYVHPTRRGALYVLGLDTLDRPDCTTNTLSCHGSEVSGRRARTAPTGVEMGWTVPRP